MAFLSIIIPVYNTAEFLPKCLDSILAQTFTDIEIICVENNSTDSSPQILQHYAQKDSRIRLYHQPTPGQSAARNMGLQYATGQYIGFVDSDDAIDSHYYQQLCQAAQKTAADIVCTGCQTVFIGALPVPVYYLPYTRCQDWAKRWQIDIAVWAKIYKKEFLQTHRFHFMPGVIWEDVLWTFKTLYKAHKIITLPGNGYFYTRNPLGTMALSKTKNRKHTLYSIKTVYQAAQDSITQNEPSFSRKKILNEF